MVAAVRDVADATKGGIRFELQHPTAMTVGKLLCLVLAVELAIGHERVTLENDPHGCLLLTSEDVGVWPRCSACAATLVPRFHHRKLVHTPDLKARTSPHSGPG